jgi:hypothetical protein
MNRPPMTRCENCNDEIGNIEDAFIYKGKNGKVAGVCEKCYNKLSKANGFSMMKLLLLVLLGGIGAIGYGYFMENHEVGGYGIFVAGGAFGVIILTFLFSLFIRK